jgi:hypothetical protein
METKKLPLSQVFEDRNNPRIISDAKFQKLIDSILAFPKMLSLRPVVIDGEHNSLGGNMRLRSLNSISQMTIDAIKQRLEGIKDYTSKTAAEQKQTLKYWKDWLKKPTVETADAADLTEDERKQFMIKDNVSVGDWDWQQLESWDAEQLQDWGVGVDMPDFGENGGGISNLPPELQGVDLIPDVLDKLQGDDRTLMQRVIIVYKPEQAKEVADMLGLDDIEKVSYKYDELK